MIVERSEGQTLFQALHHFARFAFWRTKSSRGRHGGSHEMYGCMVAEDSTLVSNPS